VTDAIPTRAASMRGTVMIAARNDHQQTAAARGELVRDAHGITVHLDDDPLQGWCVDRMWVPYSSIDYVELEHGNAAGWAEAWKP
jgi:hypothetical protein